MSDHLPSELTDELELIRDADARAEDYVRQIGERRVFPSDAEALAGAMDSDAVYSSASPDAQKSSTLEFRRGARGISVWAALAVWAKQAWLRWSSATAHWLAGSQMAWKTRVTPS